MSFAAKKRPGSRHKPRRTVALSPALYEQLAKFAEKNERPVNWQARLLIREALRAAGLWPIPGVSDEPEKDTSE